MEVVNPFILKNKERMIVFLDQLSQVTDPYTALTGLDLVQNANNQIDSDTGKCKLIQMNSITDKYFKFIHK